MSYRLYNFSMKEIFYGGRKNMSKFDYGDFGDGDCDTEFVAHAKKYTKEEVIKLFVIQDEWNMERYGLRKPTVADIREDTVRYYPIAPEFYFNVEKGEPTYGFTTKGERGSFPVWVIDFDNLKVKHILTKGETKC